MNTKLTLSIDKEIIDEAKAYAKDHSVSLSKLIENYLNSLTRESKKKIFSKLPSRKFDRNNSKRLR